MPDTRADDSDPYVLKVVEPFEGFFDREYPRMVAVAYAVSGSRWAVEELAQEACLRAYQRGQGCREIRATSHRAGRPPSRG